MSASVTGSLPLPYPRVLWPCDMDMEGFADPMLMSHLAGIAGKIVVEGGAVDN